VGSYRVADCGVTFGIDVSWRILVYFVVPLGRNSFVGSGFGGMMNYCCAVDRYVMPFPVLVVVR
jgi:hypothetical protein